MNTPVDHACTVDGVTYLASSYLWRGSVHGNPCASCCFDAQRDEGKDNECKYIKTCTANNRTDKTSVVWVEMVPVAPTRKRKKK